MKVVTFGELMMRLKPLGYERFIQANQFDVSFGGGEANVLVSLSNFGIKTDFLTALPDNEIGEMAISSLHKYGVGTNYIKRDKNRMGLYFLEQGASQRPSKVVYDRKDSSINFIDIDDFDFNEIFKDVDLFHFTGITPALNDNVAQLCEEACKAAKKQGVLISCDLNYRNKLWSKEKANKIMTKLCSYVDILIANEEDAKDVFNISSKASDINAGKLNKKGYVEVAKKLYEMFDLKYVAITLRESINANINKWSGMLYDGNEAYFSKTYDMYIVDRVGGGDSFAAGLIYALLQNYDDQSKIEFAIAASCLKHTIKGDYNLVSVKEVESLMNGNESGRVQR